MFSTRFASNYLVELTYTGNSSVNGFENREINSVSYDWANNLRLTNPTQFSAFLSNTQIFRPYPNYGSITFRTNGARSNYHAGTVKLEKRFSRGLSFLTFYTYSKGIDSSSSNNLLSRDMDRAESSNNRTHQYTGSMNYELPFGKGRKWLNRGGFINADLRRLRYGVPVPHSERRCADLRLRRQPVPVHARRGGRPRRQPARIPPGQRADLRDNWQDIGGDRFVQATQNGLIESMNYFTYPDAYTRRQCRPQYLRPAALHRLPVLRIEGMEDQGAGHRHVPVRLPEPVQVVQPVGAEHHGQLHQSGDVRQGLHQHRPTKAPRPTPAARG